MKRMVLMLFFLMITTVSYSLETGFISIERNSEELYYNVSPSLITGTHINGLGMNMYLLKRFHKTLEHSIISPNIGVYITPFTYLSNLGIPDESVHLNLGGDLSLSWGAELDLDRYHSIYREVARHNFRYYLNYYFSSDGTSQPYGGISYTLSLQKNDLILALDNDDAYFIATDKYRTTKGSIKYIRYTSSYSYGAAIGFLLWTGNLDGTATESDGDMRDSTYELTGYGGDYSHGVAELTLFYNNIHISIGYDSETIRDVIQNGWHNFYNRPEVPLVERDSRFYFQVSLNPPKYQY